VIGSVFKNAFDYIREVREWQAIQVERNRVRIRLEPLPGERVDLERARSMLSWQLDLYGFLPLLQIDFEVVPRLLPDPGTGKYRRMKSEVGAPLEQLRTIRIDGPETSASGPHRTLPVAPKSKRKRDTASGDATH
jgi:hypothetical protein